MKAENAAGQEDWVFRGFVLGHCAMIQDFRKAFLEERLPHSWLFLGEKGMGKQTLCYGLASIVLGYEGSLGLDPHNTLRESALYQRMIYSAHPEFHALHHPVTVENVRAVKKQLTQTTFGTGWKVLILPDLDLLRSECINALLKIVEDPPERVLFLLTAAHKGFPATLRSRCCTYTLQPFQCEMFFQYLESLLQALGENIELNEEMRAWIYHFARGNLGRALKGLDTAQVDLIQKTWQMLDTLWMSGPCATPSDLVGGLYRKLDLFQEILFFWILDQLKKYQQSPRLFLMLDQLWHTMRLWFQQTRELHLDAEFLVQKIFSDIAMLPRKEANLGADQNQQPSHLNPEKVITSWVLRPNFLR